MKLLNIFRINFLISKITVLIPWLKKQQGWLYPIVLFKISSYLMSFLIKAQTVRFVTMIKSIYYFLSAFNVVLAILVLTNFSDLTVNPKILDLLKTTLELAIPIIILESINEYIVDLGLFFKNMVKKIIVWVLEEETNLDDNKPSNKSRKVKIPSQDQFSYKKTLLGVDEIDYQYPEKDINIDISWKTVLFFTVLAIGASYYMYPDLYNSIYYGLKDKFFPPSGPRGGSSSLPLDKGKGVEIVSNTLKKTTYLQGKLNAVLDSNNLSLKEKLVRVTAIGMSTKLDEPVETEDMVLNAINSLQLAIDAESVHPSTSSLEGLSNISTGSSTGSLTPTNISTGSLTPTNIPTTFLTPTNIPTTSLTPAILNKGVTPLSTINIPSVSTNLIRLDHSPVLDNLPKDLNWEPFKEGGRLKGIFNLPVVKPAILDLPIAHISPYHSESVTPVTTSIADPGKLEKLLEDVNKK